MQSPFDTLINRHNSDSLKWQKYAGKRNSRGQDILPLWVADMDFAAPEAVLNALHTRLNHGVLGYGFTTPDFLNALQSALQRDYGWSIEPDWIIPLPGLVSGLNIAAQSIGEQGDAIVTSTPVYPPLFSAPKNAGRDCIQIPLNESNHWCWDIAALQRAHTPKTKGVFLCHPHNPIGRVWRSDELNAIAHYAEKNDLIVVSDEIHCDLILEPTLKHQPFAILSPAIAQRTITLMAPSKTYNIPGLGAAFAIIANPQLRQRFLAAMQGIVPHPNILGMVACTAAYRDGQAWRDDLIRYLRHNRDLVMTLDGIAGLQVIKPEATYLAWLDCRKLPYSNLAHFFEEAGVGLSPGRDFGREGFMRLNFGCPSSRLTEAVTRIRQALLSEHNKTPLP